MGDDRVQERTIRIAVLDDQRLVAEGLAAAIDGDGIEVAIVARDWAELLEHDEMPVDVAIIDLRIDDGILLATKVHTLADAGVAVVVTSGRTDPASVATVFRAGAMAFVSKRDSTAELVTAIRSAASGATHLAIDQRDSLADAPAAPRLGRREERALVLYAGGRSIREVADDMQTTEETVKSYIKRGRRKFREAGIDVGTRILLRKHAAEAGWLGHE